MTYCFENLKVAIVHDWLVTYAGAERVLEQMLSIFPHADLFSLIDFLPDSLRGFIQYKPVQTSFIQRLPFAQTRYRLYLPLMPFAVEQLDLSAYDLVISNSYAVAKGVITGPDQLHLCMCCSPIRYAWDLQNQYLDKANLAHGIKSWIARWILYNIRLWDVRSANGVDDFIAISNFIARRIRKIYRREAEVIYPPVDVSSFLLQEQKKSFYLTASRLVPYKKVDLIVEAFNKMPNRKLVVIGDGPDLGRIKSFARPNVKILGYQPFEVLRDYMQKAQAFVFAAEEDFGITPIEAQACGTPVIAYGKGGVLETIYGLDHPHPTGVFFNQQTPDSIISAVTLFESKRNQITAFDCRENAMRFSLSRFQDELISYVEKKWQAFNSEKTANH
jgi:glycosyltransferase involved in cell wall biosynthesis